MQAGNWGRCTPVPERSPGEPRPERSACTFCASPVGSGAESAVPEPSFGSDTRPSTCFLGAAQIRK